MLITFALDIGFVIVSGGYAVGSVSGAVFNPAVAIGHVVLSLSEGIGWCLAWTAFELMDAMLVAIMQLAKELDPDRLDD